jgi:hypothetical protein
MGLKRTDLPLTITRSALREMRAEAEADNRNLAGYFCEGMALYRELRRLQSRGAKVVIRYADGFEEILHL